MTTPHFNRILTDIRYQLEDDNVVAYGPGTPGEGSGEIAQTAEPGEGGAVNPAEASDVLDRYVTQIADLLAIEYGMSPDKALGFVFAAATSLAKEGLVDPIPSDNASPDEISLWLGKARTQQFSHHVLTRAQKMS